MVTLTGNEIVLVDGVDGNGRPCGVLEAVTTQQIANLGSGGGGVRTITAAGPVTVLPNDGIVGIAQTIPAPVTVTLPSAPVLGKEQTIKDVNGVSSTYPITITPSSPYLIDGDVSFILNNDYGSITYYWNGTGFSIV